MRKLIFSFVAFLVLLLFGTFGYVLIEGASFEDGLYMTFITVTTVGFGETIHLSGPGRYFTMVLILLGVGFVMFIFKEMTETVVDGGLQKALGKRKMSKKLEKAQSHYIVCGFGRIGQVICRLLAKNKCKFVVIEKDDNELHLIQELGYLSVHGDAVDDDVLLEAGVTRAKGLIGVVSSDSDNLYVTLSARSLNPKLYIISRSSGDMRAKSKFKRAGADKVISPYDIGATRMANCILKPAVVDFIDFAVAGNDLGLSMEELRVTSRSPMLNKPLMDSGLRKTYNLIVVSITRAAGQFIFNPTPDIIIMEGDLLIVLGELDQVEALEKTMQKQE